MVTNLNKCKQMLKNVEKQDQLGVPHSRIQVDLGFKTEPKFSRHKTELEGGHRTEKLYSRRGGHRTYLPNHKFG